MRTVHWLFFVSVALFVSGIGFVIAAARSGRDAAPAVEASAPAPAAVASVQQVMTAITQPAATAIYNSVGTIVNVDGITEIEPKNDEEWAALATQAAALVESGNLLLFGPRLVDTGDWVTMTRAMMEKGRMALEAAQAKDKEGILTAGFELNQTCDTCHARYQRQ